LNVSSRPKAILAAAAAAVGLEALEAQGEPDLREAKALPPAKDEDDDWCEEAVPEALDAPRASKRRGSRTRSVEELYGAAVKAGVVRIVRKKRQPPRVVFL
jgi:hypothetical protein